MSYRNLIEEYTSDSKIGIEIEIPKHEREYYNDLLITTVIESFKDKCNISVYNVNPAYPYRVLILNNGSTVNDIYEYDDNFMFSKINAIMDGLLR